MPSQGLPASRCRVVLVEDDAATIIEYALVLGVISLVAASAAAYYGQQLLALFQKFVIP